MFLSDQALSAFLLEAGLVSKRDIEASEAEARQGSYPLRRTLVERGLLSTSDVSRAMSHVLGVPFVDLRDREIDFSALSHIPEPLSRMHQAVAYAREGDTLEVAFSDLESLPEVKFVEELHGVRIAPRLTDEGSIKRTLVLYQDGLKAQFGDLISREGRALEPLTKSVEAHTVYELERIADDTRNARVFGAVLSHALAAKAATIHVEPTEERLLVRYRLGGRMHDAVVLAPHLAPHLALRAKFLAGIPLQSVLAEDGRFVYDDPRGARTHIRLSTMPTVYGERLVLRVLPEFAAGFTLESLGFSGRALEMVERALYEREGLILASGPAKSGKSTLLYTLLDILNEPDRTIHTVESAVEYQMPGVAQSQVDSSAKADFSQALRGALRQDPDILMLSDIEDSHTAALAARAALSRILVLSGIFADSAADGIAAFAEGLEDRGTFASAFSLSIGMRVVKRLGKDREAYSLSREEIDSLGQLVSLPQLLERMKEEGVVSGEATLETVPFYKPRVGSYATSEPGSIGLYEVIPSTIRIRELIMNGASRSALSEEARRSGFPTLLEDGIIKAAQGLVSLEDVIRAHS